MSAEFELQKAIKAVLEATAPLITAMGGAFEVYDCPPERSPLPYISFGDAHTDEYDTVPTETSDGYGSEHRLIINVWSDYEGKKECSAVINEIKKALRDTPLALTGHRNPNIRFRSADIGKEPDGQAYHGVAIFRAVTEEI